jgi:cytochrome c556
MKTSVVIVGLLAVALGIAGCSAPSRKIEERQRELIDTMNEFADTLATVKDDASAKAAEPKLVALAEKLHKLHDEYKEAATRESKPAVNAPDKLDKNTTDMIAAAQRYAAEMKRLQGVPGGPELIKELEPKLGTAHHKK